MNRNPKTIQQKSGGGGEEEAVDSLLREVEDDLLLNLSLNSHTSRGISHSSNSYIDPDLDRRFQSLKSSLRPPTSTQNPTTMNTTPQAIASDDGDLLARFAALKGDSTSCSSSCFQESNYLQSDRGKIATSDAMDQDEVQKLIEWAIDAARLDPSPPSDSDDDDDGGGDSSNDNDSNSDEGFGDHGGSNDNRKKGGRSKGQKGK